AGGAAGRQRASQAGAAAGPRGTDQQTRQAPDQARRLVKAGWENDNPLTLAAAVAEADKAAQLAHRGGASEEVGNEADLLLREVRTKEEQAKQNAALLAALLDVSAPRETKRYARTESGRMAVVAEPSMDEQFAAAFRRWRPNLDLDRAAPEELLRLLESQPRP